MKPSPHERFRFTIRCGIFGSVFPLTLPLVYQFLRWVDPAWRHVPYLPLHLLREFQEPVALLARVYDLSIRNACYGTIIYDFNYAGYILVALVWGCAGVVVGWIIDLFRWWRRSVR